MYSLCKKINCVKELDNYLTLSKKWIKSLVSRLIDWLNNECILMIVDVYVNMYIIYVLINACVRVCTFYHVYGNCNILIPVQVEWRVELNPSPLLWCTPTLTPKLKSAVSFSHNNLCYSISLFLSLSFYSPLSPFVSLSSFFLSFSLCFLLTIQSLEAI